MNREFSKKSRIFIAGAHGMAGSAICRKLKENGYLNLLTPTKKELNYLDLNKTINWFEKNNPDVVIIAAAKVGGILANKSNPADFILDNIKIQNNIIETSWKKMLRNLFF